MLYSISVKNFFSFREKVVIDLTVDGNAPDSTSYFSDSKKQRLTKVLACFGANASGKTNVMRAIAFAQWFISASWDLEPDKEIPFFPFAFAEKDTASELGVTFGLGGKKYTYDFKFTTKRILSERLTMAGTTRPSLLFSRKHTVGDNYEYSFNSKWYDKSVQSIVKTSKRGNASVIAAAVRGNHKLSKSISDHFLRHETNVTLGGRRSIDGRIGSALKHYLDHPELKQKAVSYLKKYDTGLTDIAIKQSTVNGELAVTAQGIHGEKGLPLVFESTGTINLVVILHELLPVLESGSLAVIDELDSDLHPFILEELIKIFLSSSTNPKNAQLVFSAHSPSILNDLDKQQVILVEKNAAGESDVWKLSDMGSKSARSDSNYYAKYMAGAFGGVPRV